MIPYERIRRGGVDTLLEYLLDELRRTQGERSELDARWVRQQRMYRALPEDEIKKFPWLGASNLVVPVIATDVDIIVARLLGLLFGPANLWAVRPLRPDMVEFAPRAEEFLKWAQDTELHAYEAVSDWILELVKLGTGVLKQRYSRQQRKVYEWRETPAGTQEQVSLQLIKDSPVLQRVALPDFYVPSTAIDLSNAAWCAERFKLTWAQLDQRVKAGIYSNSDRIGSWWSQGVQSSNANTYDREFASLDAFRPTWHDGFEFYEFWVDFDIDGDGELEALVCTIHPQTRTYLRLDFNPFFNQEKPYSVARYIRQEGRFYGIGLCELGEQAQDAISTMTNQRIDNATLLNSAMFGTLDGSGIKQGEAFYPGAIKTLRSKDDLWSIDVGQKADSTIQNEAQLLGYHEKRSGVSDWIAGSSENSQNYATATTAVNMLREGSKRFDQILRDVRNALSESGTRILELYQQYNQGEKPFLVLGEKDGTLMQQVLQFPTRLIRTGVFVDITAANGAMNKEVEARTNQIIFGLLMQFNQQMMQGLGFMMNPQVPPIMQQIAGQMIESGTKLMRRTLTAYGQQDADELVPDLQKAIQDASTQLTTLHAALPRTQGSHPTTQAAAGMAALPAGDGTNQGTQAA